MAVIWVKGDLKWPALADESFNSDATASAWADG